jgi:hypothetical protein
MIWEARQGEVSPAAVGSKRYLGVTLPARFLRLLVISPQQHQCELRFRRRPLTGTLLRSRNRPLLQFLKQHLVFCVLLV